MNAPHSQTPPGLQANWQASLELVFGVKQDKTVLRKNVHKGPLLVQRPFYPESEQVCHVYLLHPPGGVVQGDELDINITLEANAHALVTTPAAGKFYRSTGESARLTQSLQLAKQAFLEWLPQETLLFNDSQVQLTTRVSLAADARFIGWEMLCLGRKASAEPYISGQCRQHFEVWRDNKPVFIERCRIEGHSPLLKEKWGMDNWPLTATMIATHCNETLLHTVQELLAQYPVQGHISATLKQDILICRFLGEQAEHARSCFIEIWRIIRPAIMNHSVHIPRIWNT